MRGLTRTELLVAIVVIVVVGAVLIPACAKRKDIGRGASCISSTKQIVLAARMYAEEHDDRLPPGAFVGTAQGSPVMWYGALMPIVKAEAVFWCPQALSADVAYGWNFRYFGYSPDYPGPGWCTALSDVPDPSTAILVGDCPDKRHPYFGKGLVFAPLWEASREDNQRDLSGRHNDGANYGFVDGHAKWIGRDRAAAVDAWGRPPVGARTGKGDSGDPNDDE